MRLKDKVVIVTGSAGGLGFYFCKAFLKEGAQVAVTDISNELVDKAVVELSSAGQVIGVVANVCQQPAIENMVATVVERFGRLDILVNNAGGSLHTPYKFEEISEEHWDRVVDVNLKGTFLCCQSAVRQFRKQGGGGRIVNVSALAGRWLGSLRVAGPVPAARCRRTLPGDRRQPVARQSRVLPA